MTNCVFNLFLCRQSKLVEIAVYDMVDTLKSNLSESQQANLSPEVGYACTQPDTKNKKQRCQECQPCSYYALLNYFTQRNSEALVKCK
jgi:dynein heavy chain